MVQKGHATASPDEPEHMPQPAIPILASHLLQLEEKQRNIFVRHGRPERLSTDCEDIDDILGGGVERGIVMGISAEGVAGQLISLNVLASTLLPHLTSPTSISTSTSTKATIIDTTGSFNLPLLVKILRSRITTSHAISSRNAIHTANHAVSRLNDQRDDPETKTKIEADIQKCLEMIAISRVFDIEGLWEVLGELDRGQESTSAGPAQDGQSKENAQAITEEIIKSSERNESEKKPDEIPQSSPDWPEINDSEASSSNPSLTPPPWPTTPDLPTEDIGTEILIINNISTIITELFSRKEKSDAHTLLALLSRHLKTHATTTNTLTILHNTTTSSRLPPSTLDPDATTSYSHSHSHNPHNYNTSNSHQNPFYNPRPHPQTQKSNPNPLPTSLFPSNPLKPSLGSYFTNLPHIHIFISSLPRGREDAEVLYSRDEAQAQTGTETQTEKVNYVNVVEVFKDECPASLLPVDKDKVEREKTRLGYREQRWCAVGIDSTPYGQGAGQGTRLKGAFEMRGGMRGMGMERRGIGRGIISAQRGNEEGHVEGQGEGGKGGEGVGVKRGLTGTETDVGNIAKIWGFGGRRV